MNTPSACQLQQDTNTRSLLDVELLLDDVEVVEVDEVDEVDDVLVVEVDEVVLLVVVLLLGVLVVVVVVLVVAGLVVVGEMDRLPGRVGVTRVALE